MDPARFDALTRSAANRRDLVTKLGIGGLAAALAAGLGVRGSAAQTATCSLALRAFVRLGPSAGIPLVPTANQAGNIDGTLEMTIAGGGSVENAAFVLADGTSFSVVGQATGHQLAVRVALDEQRTLVLQGVAEQPLSICQGAIDGSLIGPTEGDLGDWHGVAIAQVPAIATETPAALSVPTIAAPGGGVVNTPPTQPISTPTQPMPTPSPTAECVPLGPAEACAYPHCDLQDDGCGGTIDCGTIDCANIQGHVCHNGECCWLAQGCGTTECGALLLCGRSFDCGSCSEGYSCIDNSCCGNPGTGCFVGGDCCSGSCSMLNGCN